MNKTNEKDKLWVEFGIVVLVYSVINVGYALLYNNDHTQDWPSLLQSFAEMLGGKNRYYIVAVSLYLFFTALPLVVSSFLVSLILNADSKSKLFLSFLAVVVPFVVYFYLIDRSSFDYVVHQAKGCSMVNAFPLTKDPWSISPSPSVVIPAHEICTNDGYSWWFTPFAWQILKFYFFTYKLPLTVGSIILGLWLGARIGDLPDLIDKKD